MKKQLRQALVIGILMEFCAPLGLNSGVSFAAETGAAAPTPTPTPTPAPAPAPAPASVVASEKKSSRKSKAAGKQKGKAKEKTAAKEKPKTPTKAKAAGPEPVEALQERLLKAKPNKNLVTLREAFEALREGHTVSARNLAGKIKPANDYYDFALWLQASALLKDAESALSQKKVAETLILNRKAIGMLGRIQAEFPYSALARQVTRLTAQAEILTGQAACGEGERKNSACRKPFENAFLRLQNSGDLGLVRPKELEIYSDSCTLQPDPLCLSWLRKLHSFYPRNSHEMKTLVQKVPEGLDLGLKAPSHSRATQSYRGQDPDLMIFESAMGHLFEKKNSEAIREFRQYLDEFPRSSARFRARYWLAKALLQEGKKNEAKVLFEDLQRDSPLTYYGLISSFETGKQIQMSIDTRWPMALATDPFLSPLEVVRLRRAEALLTAGARELAGIELKELKARYQHSSPFLFYLSMLQDLAGNHSTAFTIVNELILRNHPAVFSSYGVRLIFPLAHEEQIRKIATEQRLDPILVMSLIKQESAFDHFASSHVGATGLMQLMPATAVDVTATLHRADLVRVEENLQTGMKYLKKLLVRYNGNVVYALGAYNAGPGAMDRWIRSVPPGTGMVDFIERIPYRETREYVAAIVRNHFWYTHRLGGELKHDLAHFWVERQNPVMSAAPVPASLEQSPAEEVPLVPGAEAGASAGGSGEGEIQALPAATPAEPAPAATATPEASPSPEAPPTPSASSGAEKEKRAPASAEEVPQSTETPGEVKYYPPEL